MWKECALPDTHLDGGAQYGGTLTQACCHGYHGTNVLFSFIVYFGKVNGVHMGIVNYLVRILMKRLRQGVSYSDDFSLTVLTKFCTSNSYSKIF